MVGYWDCELTKYTLYLAFIEELWSVFFEYFRSKDLSHQVYNFLIIIFQVRDYVTGLGTDVPLLLLGDAGCGKSSVMAKVAEVATQMAALRKIPGYGNGENEKTIGHVSLVVITRTTILVLYL